MYTFCSAMEYSLAVAGPVEALKIRGGNVLKSQNLGGQYIVIGCIFSIREVNLRKK